MFSWQFDAATGVYKNHALAGELLKVAARNFVMVRFTKKQPNFGKHQGESVTLQYYKPAAEPTSAQLSESQRMPIDDLVMDGRTITVAEFGRAIRFTNLSLELSKFSPKEGAQKQLVDIMGASMDSASATSFKEAKVCFTPTAAGAGTIDTDGSHSTAALVNLDVKHCGVLRDYMANDLHVPPFEGGDYVGAFATKGLRGLKNDSTLQTWNQYLGKGDLLYKSEVGKIEDIRFVEVKHEQAFSNGVGTGSVLGEGVVFGDDAVRRVEVEAPHLRAQMNLGSDFGRKHAVAWYGILAFGCTFITPDDREARIIRVGSQ